MVIIVSVIAWVSIPPVLSRVMVRRGSDGTSYGVGAIFGPLAVAFAVMEVLFDVPEPPRILEEGWTDQGYLSVLLVIGGESTMSPPTTALVGVEPRLGRLGLAQVLPTGAGRIHCCGDQLSLFAPGRLSPGRWCPDGTQALPASPVAPARIRPVRTV